MPSGKSDIGEEGAIQVGAVNEYDVVVGVGVEQLDAVDDPAVTDPVQRASGADLDRVSDDLLEIRIADEEIGQRAGIGRTSAGQLCRSRNPVRLCIARVGNQPLRDAVGRADRRVEPVVGVTT